MKSIHLLIVEDEEAIRDMLQFSLQRENFRISTAENVAEAKKILAESIPNVIILDWMLPDQSGIAFMKWLRKEKTLSHLPIIMLTAKAEEDSKVRGLMSGADDYITKPFSPNELIARIRTVLRRGLIISPENIIQAGLIQLHIEKQEITINQQPLDLFPADYRLLYFFMKHPDKTWTREQLIHHIYEQNTEISDRTIDVQIKRLREKLKPYAQDKHIKTIHGSGYCFLKKL